MEAMSCFHVKPNSREKKHVREIILKLTAQVIPIPTSGIGSAGIIFCCRNRIYMNSCRCSWKHGNFPNRKVKKLSGWRNRGFYGFRRKQIIFLHGCGGQWNRLRRIVSSFFIMWNGTAPDRLQKWILILFPERNFKKAIGWYPAENSIIW